ncbi:IclR family transcriptional regulator [Frigidibacter sp.]|uniref:IclR family transcriptional regulator n=1 Tax=Frigidibacter sp. TaxID=2586418 RepID=UPI0027376A24|nr:IclR family transcriptional regulator [Frigidibacter sp.]MDP3342427.1 IclR family transcriptional regulator [Frigidibacter sp.]
MSGTVEKALKLLELLSKYDGPVRMAELSRAADMNKSTAYRMLEVMSQMGYVTQDEPNGRYMMTTRMWEIGVRAFQRNDLRVAARPYLQELMEQTEETAILTRRDGCDVIIVEKVDCAQQLQAMVPLGSRSPIHASSFGKAFLMVEPADRVLALGPDLKRFTEQTITDLGALQANLDKARIEGAAVGVNEYREGVAGVAAPVIGTDGVTYGAIGISLPSFRLTDAARTRFLTAVSEVARRFSEQIGHRLSA